MEYCYRRISEHPLNPQNHQKSWSHCLCCSFFWHGSTTWWQNWTFSLHIPLEISQDFKYNISYNSQLAHSVRQTKLILWDEALMQSRRTLEAVDRSFQDICRSVKPFGASPWFYYATSNSYFNESSSYSIYRRCKPLRA